MGCSEIEIVSWNYVIVYKLLVLGKNIWNYIIVWELFVLDMNTWYHIIDYRSSRIKKFSRNNNAM